MVEAVVVAAMVEVDTAVAEAAAEVSTSLSISPRSIS